MLSQEYSRAHGTSMAQAVGKEMGPVVARAIDCVREYPFFAGRVEVDMIYGGGWRWGWEGATGKAMWYGTQYCMLACLLMRLSYEKHL